VTRNPWLWATLAAKALLVGLLVLAVLRPDLEQFQGKAMAARALTYPLAALLVPVVWGLWFRRRSAYPYLLDIVVVAPFLIDTAGNALNLYDTIGWWDDANHLVNWFLVAGAGGLVLLRLPVGRLAAAGLTLGFGAVTHILWELAEYVAFINANEEELATAYTDTLGDMALSLTGSALAALAVYLLWARRRAPA